MAIEKQGLCKIILWVVALCLVISAWWWILPSLVNHFFTFSVDAPGNLEREWQGEALVLPQGEPVLAPVAGKVTFLVRHGQWVAPGSIVAEIIDSTGRPEVVYSPVGGLVDLAVMIPQKAWLLGTRQEKNKGQDGDVVTVGTELAWIIRPHRILLRVQLPFQLPSFVKLQGFVAETGGPATQGIKMTWYATRMDSVKAGVVDLDVTGFPMEWLERETLSVILKLKGPIGQRVPKSAILNYRDQAGVLVVTQSGHEFRNVEILDEVDREVVVGGLELGDRVVTRPRLVMRK